jgi:hypothetical protein
MGTLFHMIGFFIKKSFFDGWDNLLGMIIQNLLYLCVVFGVFGCMSIPENLTWLIIVLLALLCGVFAFLQAGTGENNYAYAHYEREGYKGFKRGIATSWHHALLYWGLSVMVALLIFFVMPFYMAYKNLFGLFVTVILFWVVIALVTAMMFFFPLHYTMSGDRPLKTLKKCFIIMLDNIGITLFTMLYAVVQAVLSVLTMGLIPGAGGMQLMASDCIKLLMLKYDYLEAHPEADRKKMPWYDLLYDDRESVGPRSFKGMIFPWKD